MLMCMLAHVCMCFIFVLMYNPIANTAVWCVQSLALAHCNINEDLVTFTPW